MDEEEEDAEISEELASRSEDEAADSLTDDGDDPDWAEPRDTQRATSDATKRGRGIKWNRNKN